MITCESFWCAFVYIQMFVVLSNASHITDLYNSVLACTLCTVGLPSTMHFIIANTVFSIFDESIYKMDLVCVSSSCICSY